MNQKTKEECFALVDRATAGDKAALEALILSVQDLVFNLSLRMLGTFSDAEDAAQDILVQVMTHLSSFKKESAFSTWVFRIATNHLIHYKKHLFAKFPLSFSYYGEDIDTGKVGDVPDLTQDVEKNILAEELKMSCTNVMLQCLDTESRLIFVLGTMFQMDSRIAGELLGLSPAAYRQRLSRIRRKVADFLSAYCGAYGNGKCRCQDRVNYAIHNHRLQPAALDYTAADEIPLDELRRFKEAMEEIDELSAQFSFCKAYASPDRTKQFFKAFLESAALSTVKNT